MGDSDKQSLLWSTEEIFPRSQKDIKGKQKIETDFIPEFPNEDVRISIDSIDSKEKTISREELRKVWTPQPPLVRDDKVRRSSLWDSAVGLSNDLKTFNEDSNGKIREEIRAEKLVGEIEAIKEQSLDLLSQSNNNPHRQSHIELEREINTVNYLEIEMSSNHLKTELKDKVQKSNKKRNSMSERLSELLRPTPVPIVEKKKTSKASKEIRVSALNCSELRKPNSIAERMPPEWAILLLGCVLGLSSGISVVVFNKGVCILQILHFIYF